MAETIRPYRGGEICPGCRTPGLDSDVLVLESEGVPPLNPGHGLVYSHWIVRACGNCGAGVLERLSHDCFPPLDPEDDPWDLIDQYPLSPADMTRLRTLIREECTRPLEPTCPCALHGSLRPSCAALPRDYSSAKHACPITLSPPGEQARFVPITTTA